MFTKKQTIYFSTYDDIKNPHYGGGGAIAVHEVAKRLSKEYVVRVISWNYSGRKHETIDSVQYERFGFSFLSPKIAMFVYQITLPFVASTKTYDIWFESFCPPFTTSFLPLFTKKQVVGIVHMLAAEDMERKYKLPFHIVEKSGIQMYRKIIVTSEFLKKKIQILNPNCSVTVISNGITKVFKPKYRKQKYVLFLGRIEINQKGIDLLISAFKLFHTNRFKDYKLVIAGTGDSYEVTKMNEIIRSAALKNFTVLKGKVAGKTKESLLQNAACVVISSRFETFSLVALEAMANGAPLICFAIDGLKWIPQKAAKKILAFDVKKLSNAITTLLTNESLIKSVQKEGQLYAAQFTWDSIAAKYKAYLQQQGGIS